MKKNDSEKLPLRRYLFVFLEVDQREHFGYGRTEQEGLDDCRRIMKILDRGVPDTAKPTMIKMELAEVDPFIAQQ